MRKVEVLPIRDCDAGYNLGKRLPIMYWQLFKMSLATASAFSFEPYDMLLCTNIP